MSKEIPLTRGYFAIVDDEDYDFISQWKWYAYRKESTDSTYACRDIRIDGKKKCIHMHRLLNKTPEGFVTDHINGNGLDNQKANLRSATHQENMINCRRRKIGSSKYRGISWHIGNKKWYAQMTVNSKNMYIGSFKTELEAKEAYDKFRSKIRKNQIIREDAI